MFKIKAGENLLTREREILKMISKLLDQRLNFIVVGGYAVATFRHRFSVDLDLVITKEDLEKFESVLKKNGYSLACSKELSLVYGEAFKRFIKYVDRLPVHVDLLINGLVSRTTDASWSFGCIKKSSEKSKLDGLEFLVPNRELLTAMKLHSGRLSDMRDIAALAEDADFKAVKKHASVGNKDKLKTIIKNGIKVLSGPNFADGFKGIFGSQFYNKESVERAKKLLNSLK